MTCPFCGLADGFHDEAVHSAIPIPAHLTRPPNSTRASSDVCANSKCAQPFATAGAGGCRNPRHVSGAA